jgi:uncharacterized protein YbjT (DUF2867 family)
MILVTGGTGFVGRVLLRHLVEQGHMVRTLIRPSPHTPRLPVGVPVEVAVSSLADVRGLRAAMRDVNIVYHLASAENQGARGDLFKTDVLGTQNLTQAAADSGIQRIFYVSHLDASRDSAFPVHRAKGLAEEHLRKSGVPYTIFRSSILFGPEDHFTTNLVSLLRLAPGILPLPYGGQTLVQPLWVEDLVTCLLWSLERSETINQTYEVGGSEFFSIQQVSEIIMSVAHRQRLIVPMSIPMLRGLTVLLENAIPKFPVSTFWLDYLAVDRTCEVNALPRIFGLMPARFTYRLDYLMTTPWYVSAWQSLRERNSRAVLALGKFLQSLSGRLRKPK